LLVVRVVSLAGYAANFGAKVFLVQAGKIKEKIVFRVFAGPETGIA